MDRLSILFFAVPLALAASAGGVSRSAGAAPRTERHWDAVVARVNGHPLTRGEFGGFLVRSVGRKWLRTMMIKDLIEMEARDRGIKIAPEELDKRVDKAFDRAMTIVARKANMTRQKYEAKLAAEGQDLDAVRAVMRAKWRNGLKVEMLL